MLSQISNLISFSLGNSNRSAVAFTAVQAISVSKSSVQSRKKTLATIKPYVPSNNNNKVEKEPKDENNDLKNKFALFFERFQELLNLDGVGGREAKISVEQVWAYFTSASFCELRQFLFRESLCNIFILFLFPYNS